MSYSLKRRRPRVHPMLVDPEVVDSVLVGQMDIRSAAGAILLVLLQTVVLAYEPIASSSR